jgi:threonine dehydrogenase-like Zn-dependent dehydrogenase
MNKSLEEMTNAELRRYLSENRNDENAFSQALELLMSRKQNTTKYPSPLSMSYDEVEAIFKDKIKQISH